MDNDSAMPTDSTMSFASNGSDISSDDVTPLLLAQGISKSFGGVRAVDNVDLVVDAGECLGLVGPNGAGKTTLFNCICGQVRQDSGSLLFKGMTLDRMPTFRRARLGIGRTYQRIEIFPDLTVEQHLLVAERARLGDGRLWKDLLRRSAPRPAEFDAVNHALELVDLLDVRSVPVSALGLGTCRLVELARALVGQPDLLMADEPSSAWMSTKPASWPRSSGSYSKSTVWLSSSLSTISAWSATLSIVRW